MEHEIERKFLLKNKNWKKEVSERHYIEQFYIGSIKGKTFRTRMMKDTFIYYFITIKVATDAMGDNIEIERKISKEEFDVLNSEIKDKILFIAKLIHENNIEWEVNVINKIVEELTSEEKTSLDKEFISKIMKFRNKIKRDGVVWEIDEFKGLNDGLIMAEIELKHRNQVFVKPEWIGEEVTEDKRYYNGYLSKNKVI